MRNTSHVNSQCWMCGECADVCVCVCVCEFRTNAALVVVTCVQYFACKKQPNTLLFVSYS